MKSLLLALCIALPARAYDATICELIAERLDPESARKYVAGFVAAPMGRATIGLGGNADLNAVTPYLGFAMTVPKQENLAGHQIRSRRALVVGDHQGYIAGQLQQRFAEQHPDVKTAESLVEAGQDAGNGLDVILWMDDGIAKLPPKERAQRVSELSQRLAAGGRLVLGLPSYPEAARNESEDRLLADYEKAFHIDVKAKLIVPLKGDQSRRLIVFEKR